MSGVFKKSPLRWLFLFLSLASVAILFQNCGQPGSIGMTEGSVVDDSGLAVRPEFSQKEVSSSDAPPLKIFFLIDNSNSMTLNNLNLQNSITAMFSNESESLSQFDTDLYFFTTAQLSKIAEKFALKTVTAESLSNLSLQQIQTLHRSSDNFAGTLAGDLLGFSTTRATTTDLDTIEFRAQPVVNIIEQGATRSIQPSIRYYKGSSLDDLQNQVRDRLSIISPARASTLTDVDAFPALDTESAMCGLARILKDETSYFKPGDISSFIIVSDENDTDPSGNNCLAKKSKEFLYQATCQKRTPASVVNQTQINYQTLMGSPSFRTTFTITTPDQVKNKIATTLTLKRAAKNASCSAKQQREFRVDFEVINKSFVIDYSKTPVIGYREGNIPIYGTEQTNLTTANQSGTVPTDCLTNVARLQTLISDSSSKLKITGCRQNADVAVAQNTKLLFSSHLTVDLQSSNQCTSSVLNSISNSGSRIIGTCRLSAIEETISASALTGKGFTSTGSETTCRDAVNRVCSESNNTLRACSFISYAAAVTFDEKISAPTVNNTALSCSSTCATFSGLCANDNTTTVSSFASSIGYSCTASTANSSETYTVPGSLQTIQVTQSAERSCNSTCAEVPLACGNISSSQLILNYNKSCSSSVTRLEGAAPQSRTLAKVDDPNQVINCDSLCSNSNGICAGSRTIAEHITSLSGQNCSFVRTSRTIPEVIENQIVNSLRKNQLVQDYCAAGFSKIGTPSLTSQSVETLEKVSGEMNLADYIIDRLRSRGSERATTISSFITPAGAGFAATATSYGEHYEQLTNRWNAGRIHDIRITSYAPALNQLSRTLKDQLIRSISFPEVTGMKRIRSVWQRKSNAANWLMIDNSLWSATGGTVTLDSKIELDFNDEIRIEYY